MVICKLELHETVAVAAWDGYGNVGDVTVHGLAWERGLHMAWLATWVTCLRVCWDVGRCWAMQKWLADSRKGEGRPLCLGHAWLVQWTVLSLTKMGLIEFGPRVHNENQKQND